MNFNFELQHSPNYTVCKHDIYTIDFDKFFDTYIKYGYGSLSNFEFSIFKNIRK